MTPIVLTLLLLVSSPAGASEQVKRLEWTDPQGRKPLNYARWVETHKHLTDASCIGSVTQIGDGNVVDVVVNAELYPQITAELSQYQTDLVSAGYAVRIDTMRGFSHVALRNHLAAVTDIAGAVLVGDLPVAWYEDGWGTPTGEEFPIELFFMDLNGTWVDADADGLYDDHTGNTAPEIWVGRLDALPLTWDDEVRLMRRYFAKNHAYRSGGLVLPDRALAYVDDDWTSFGNCNLNLVYANVTTVTDQNTTRASDYRARLAAGYEWIQVCSHSSPWGHTFSTPTGYSGTVFNTEVYAIRPRAHFYNLFACSGTRFVEENCSVGWDVFQDDYGLTAVGSTKTGSLLHFADFYTPLGQGKCIGEAFRLWMVKWAEADRDWFYGLNIVGDPTLKPHGGQNYCGAADPGSDASGSSANLRALSSCEEKEKETGEPDGELASLSEVVGTHPETDDSPDIMSMPDGKVWAIWKSGRSSTNGRFDIFASVRSGGVWSSPYNVGNAYYWETDPVLGLDQAGRPVAVWAVFTDDYHYNLSYSIWTGSSWSAAQQLSEDCSSDLAPSLARDSSGILWCLWTSRRDLFADVFVSSYNGSTWSSPVNITRDSATDLYPCAAATPDNRVWVVYTSLRNGAAEIWAQYRSGSLWYLTGPVSGAQRKAYRPAVAVGPRGQPIVCWQSFDQGNGDICYSRYDGLNWSTPAVVDSDTSLDVRPRVCTDVEGKPWVVWMSARPGNWDCYYSYFVSDQWTRAQPVAAIPGPDMNPDIAATPSSMWVAWQNLTSGNWDIFAQTLPLSGCNERKNMLHRGVQASPNPFRKIINVQFTASFPADLWISDALGRLVRTLAVGRQRSAVSSVSWDGLDDAGSPVPAGAYFIRAGSGCSEITRVLLVR
ncbi:MAG: FlgD immunoglobulin-like domain containing protein [candidate division WOR-3 bacterium]